ncbi:MAG: nucleotidyltransferase family protein [Gallionellaceae bacterium]
MNSWKSLILAPATPLSEAIAKIDAGCRQIAMVADPHGRLLGTLADGDIRRAILTGMQLTTPCHMAMNPRPTTATPDSTRESLLMIMRRGAFHQVPLVDTEGVLVGLVTMDELVGSVERDNWVVLMAGGLGTRLHPLTKNCPKPLLRVGGAPILEHILMAFIGQGFRHFFLSVNYKAEMITDYFGDGQKWGVEIRYLHETEPMGTAGALSLLPTLPQSPLIVMNGDLLTHADFVNILQFHEQSDAMATMAVREFEYQIPYGVVRVDGASIINIEEKPTHKSLVSSGIYVISPAALQFVQKQTFYDMPTLFRTLIASNKRTAAYMFNEYWLDIGRIDEFDRAQREWAIGQ